MNIIFDKILIESLYGQYFPRHKENEKFQSLKSDGTENQKFIRERNSAVI